jgi:hypothetical protein
VRQQPGSKVTAASALQDSKHLVGIAWTDDGMQIDRSEVQLRNKALPQTEIRELASKTRLIKCLLP